VSNIMDLERCRDFFFFEGGLKLKPRAWAIDSDGDKFVENCGKRCLVVSSIHGAWTGPIPIYKSGRDS